MSADHMQIEQLPHHRWPSGTDFWIASLAVRFADLAARIGLRTDRWEEDGLGPAVGALCRLSSGTVILLQELQHAVTYHGAQGPDVSADLGEVAARGIAAVREQALTALGLTIGDVTATPTSDADGDRSAREQLEQVTRWQSSRSHPPGG